MNSTKHIWQKILENGAKDKNAYAFEAVSSNNSVISSPRAKRNGPGAARGG